MNHIRSFLVVALLALFLTGCNNSTEPRSPHAYIGGKIVNPIAEYLVVSRDTTILDTVFLDENHQFSYRLEDVDQGLYTFTHQYENQLVHVSPGDSLLVWVNTLEFDESLYFSGIGAEKNNLLVNLYLLNERNTDLVLDTYEMEPERFEAQTDSIKKQRLDTLRQLDETADLPDDYVEKVTMMIHYEHRDLRERFAYLVNKYHNENADKFPETYFDYRENIDFNEKDLRTNPTYLRFIENYLINLSMADCEGNPEINYSCYNPNDNENIIRRIELIDSLTSLPTVKNHFFYRLGALGMVMGKDRAELMKVLELLQEKEFPEEDLFDLVTLGNIQLAFFPGTSIDQTPLINSEGEEITASTIIDKPTIIFLWSLNSPNHHKRQHKTIRELRNKYPDIEFIGINVNSGSIAPWRLALQKFGYKNGMEYQLGEIRLGEQAINPEVFTYYLNKLLFIDESGTVVIGDANLNAPDFESRILEFLNM